MKKSVPAVTIFKLSKSFIFSTSLEAFILHFKIHSGAQFFFWDLWWTKLGFFPTTLTEKCLLGENSAVVYLLMTNEVR